MTIKRVDRGRNHSYTIDGKKAIGVTTALSEGMPKPALPYWAARTVAETVVDMDPDDLAVLRRQGRAAAVAALKQAPWTQRDNAALRGTKVHQIAEQLALGDEVSVPDELVGHVESVLKFLTDWKVSPVLQEKVVGSYKYGYAGTFDLIADVYDGRRVLFDYKTSTGIYPETALQLNAYAYADFYVADAGIEIPMREVHIDEIKAVHVRADGYDVIPLSMGAEQMNAFLNVLGVARARKDMDGWVLPAEEVHFQENAA